MSGVLIHCCTMKTTDSMAPLTPRKRVSCTPQLSFDLPQQTTRPKRASQRCSQERAEWWFQMMRRVVEEELDYPLPIDLI